VVSFRPFKGRNRAPLTAEIPILRELQSVVDATDTGDLTFLVTKRGQPFTAAEFGNWFRDRCNEAALMGLSAHGMRKAAATHARRRAQTAGWGGDAFAWNRSWPGTPRFQSAATPGEGKRGKKLRFFNACFETWCPGEDYRN